MIKNWRSMFFWFGLFLGLWLALCLIMAGTGFSVFDSSLVALIATAVAYITYEQRKRLKEIMRDFNRRQARKRPHN